VYQFEAGIDISATPGLKQSNSNWSDSVNGALFSRNSYIGFASPAWGAVKIGKTDAPYKNSTAMFNPFSGMIGDYSVIMGNTGGDNRVEFGTRLSHAIWYESPTWNGLNFNVLVSPGQNRANNDDNLASGESDCTGGNDPTSGGNPLVTCSDGSFGTAVSANVAYTGGPLYVTAAYELHQKVNRQSDIAGAYGAVPVLGPQNCQTAGLPTPTAVQLCMDDVANEWAWKVGVMYSFPTGTKIGGIYESMHRDVPADLAFQNERTRNGTWLVIEQKVTETDELDFGWAHAFKAQGDPGQHNTATIPYDGGLAFYAPNDNQANMTTAAWKHMWSENLQTYITGAATFNGPSAHYDLGAGGRSVTTDCHDAFNASGGIASAPHCYAGALLVGVSTGVKWRF
jgi:predicted porin